VLLQAVKGTLRQGIGAKCRRKYTECLKRADSRYNRSSCGRGGGDDFTQMLLGQPLSSGRCFYRSLLRSMRASGIHTRHLQVFWFKMHSKRKTEKRILRVKSQMYCSVFSPVIKNTCLFNTERGKAHYDIISDTEIIINKTLAHQWRKSEPLDYNFISISYLFEWHRNYLSQK